MPSAPCDHCVDQTRIPDAIRFHISVSVLIACFYCGCALPFEVIRGLHSLTLRSQRMADVANDALARIAAERPAPPPPLKIKKKVKKKARKP